MIKLGMPCFRCCCSRGPTLEPFVATSLIQLLCRMTKLGWFEDDAYRGLADEARNFLEKGTAVRQLWVLLCSCAAGLA